MSRYLDVARDIFFWLEGLQVSQKVFDVTASETGTRLRVIHPVDGDIEVQAPPAPAGLFQANGLAFRKKGETDFELYDAGGIYDPVDGRVQGEHYSTTHFALLAAILFVETQDQAFLTSAKHAIGFHLRTSSTEYEPISEWMYHWDFQNYAFILTFRLLRKYLSAEERMQWQSGLKEWRTNHKNKLTNWAAMRAWAFAERGELFGSPMDRLKTWWNLRQVLKASSQDGCFDDNLNLSRPIQYHIFTVALLHRIWLVTRESLLRGPIQSGIDYFLPFIDPDGVFNYLGRGHEQIFGYAAAIYALESGFTLTKDDRLLAASDRIFDYLLTYQKNGYFPLCLNERPDEERPGWYDYHHLTVYNAFLGAWLALAHLLNNERPVKSSPEHKKFTWYSAPTKTGIVSRAKYYAAFYGGLEEYLCEASVTPHHLWWEGLGCIFSCPGGPTPDRFGKHSPPDLEKNLFAPIAKNGSNWYLPAAKTAEKFELDLNLMRIEFDYGPFVLIRLITFENDTISFKDDFCFKIDQTFEDFRWFNMPVAVEKFDVSRDNGSLVLSAGKSNLRVDFLDDELSVEALEITIGAKGKVQAFAKRQLNYFAAKGERKTMEFQIKA